MSTCWIALATEMATECWEDPAVYDIEKDDRLTEVIAQKIAGWIDLAARAQQNADYYRGLVEQCGRAIGEDAYIADDGSRAQDVLCAKVPELVELLCMANSVQIDPDEIAGQMETQARRAVRE